MPQWLEFMVGGAFTVLLIGYVVSDRRSGESRPGASRLPQPRLGRRHADVEVDRTRESVEHPKPSTVDVPSPSPAARAPPSPDPGLAASPVARDPVDHLIEERLEPGQLDDDIDRGRNLRAH